MKKIILVLLILTVNSFANNRGAMKNIGSYFEIPVTDLDRAMKFYSSVFNCEFSKEEIHGNEMAFFPFNGEKSGITGALAKGEIYKPSTSGSLIYLSTNNVEKTLEKIKTLGGEILFPKTAAGEYGYVAEFKDLEGNRIALFESK
jgi:predicted enzyme related to lactoylglutathione lyase